ncbi:hypothetical protein SPRG_16495 [Saprolegnia parasitica CBS 223.65]|uniref:F-box domain-containing protein n=1 Tax=Saprolegnia parasitica (strain CBS 223.65) TaxID=695850 RepID=A0A067BIA9_SAPPC|nr:hypothetical protein SPRG_16495 [Saprolegnia parasitica CBS 223.65]KDO18134.1 hypothetical protein SPRG_16495 [Saprolegnia parasitica CBS 223.65]|eukprot:XP_012211159.1 hypothetical protein SPRG_16495 [Saprolegnia parasitica CBS 223.65]
MTTIHPRPVTTILPSVVLHAILRATSHGADVFAILEALPVATLLPEFVALWELGAGVNLADHWPIVHITRFRSSSLTSGVYVDAGFTSLTWLDVTLPPNMSVTLVVDPTVPGPLCAFACNWGDCITEVIVKGRAVRPDPIPDILSRCVNVRAVAIECAATPVAAAAYLAAIPTTHLHTLRVCVVSTDALDASGIVAWLQGPNATSLSLSCASVRDPVALASAIQDCATLSSLALGNALNVQVTLATSPQGLCHVTALALSQGSKSYTINVLSQLNVVSFALQNHHRRALPVPDVMSILAMSMALETLNLVNWTLPAGTVTGACPRLATATLRRMKFKHAATVPQIIQWLSTSHRLAFVSLCDTVLDHDGVLELARALPVWMASGLASLRLDGTGLTDDDAIVLAIALASKRNRRPLTIDMTANQLSVASAPVLLTALGACCDVTLHLGHPFALNGTGEYDSLDESDDEGEQTIQHLVHVHRLRYRASGIYVSPSQTSSPWHAL